MQGQCLLCAAAAALDRIGVGRHRGGVRGRLPLQDSRRALRPRRGVPRRAGGPASLAPAPVRASRRQCRRCSAARRAARGVQAGGQFRGHADRAREFQSDSSRSARSVLAFLRMRIAGRERGAAARERIARTGIECGGGRIAVDVRGEHCSRAVLDPQAAGRPWPSDTTSTRTAPPGCCAAKMRERRSRAQRRRRCRERGGQGSEQHRWRNSCAAA